MNQSKIVFIVGPTAVGKTDIALVLAKKLDGEIVSCDSMQVYREISIVNDKPAEDVRQSVTHYLLDVVSVEDEFDVVRYRELAMAAIHDILHKGKIAFVVGGSGLYMQVLLDGIFLDGAKDEALREKLLARAQREGNQALHNELTRIDPDAAAKIHVNDRKRVVRALEVFQLTGTRMSELQTQRSGLWGAYDIHIFAINRERTELYRLIDQRVDEMFAAGLAEEVQALEKLRCSATVQQSIGIKEVRASFQGEYDLERAKELMKQSTRNFAKRQLTWFRKDQRLRWIDRSTDHDSNSTAKKIMFELGFS